MPKVKETAPVKACVFGCKESPFAFAKGEDGTKEAHLSITGYSGGVIKNHWYWGDLVMDTEGIEFRKDIYPILYDHDTDQRIGFSGKPVIRDHAIVIDNGTLLDNDTANKFRKDAEQGFPFEASVRVEPLEIQRLRENEVTEVNGFTFNGPGTIFRKFVYKEVSACGFGWDSNTSSVVGFSQDDNVSYILTEQETNMDINVFKEQNPEEYAQFCNSITEPLNKRIAELETELSKKAKAAEDATALSEDLRERVNKLERENLLRDEREAKAAFAAKVTARLENSSLPSRLHTKFAATISRDRFLDKDGKFDDAAFSAFMDAELKEWEDATAPTVIGGGAGSFSHGNGTAPDGDDPISAFGSKEAYEAFMKNAGVTVTE